MQKTNETKTPKKNTVQAVIFDLDGVLMDSEWLAFRVWRERAAQFGGQLQDDAFSEMVGTTAEETAEIVMRRTGVTFDIAESCEWVWKRVDQLLHTSVEPLPGGSELVHELARRGFPLAIASNSPTSYIEIALASLNLAGYFPVKVGIDQVTLGKPAPDVYLRAASQLGAAPERCLAIEDSRVGAQAAAAAGMRVLAVPGAGDHNNGFHGAWRLYSSLIKVKDELEEVLA